MQIFIAGLMSIFFCGGCLAGADVPQVEFAFFNLSTNEIRVTGVIGLPVEASPGRLQPVHSDTNRLEEKGSIYFEPVRIADQLKIVWEERGSTNRLELKRSDLKIPAKLTSGKVRFTYLGNDKWRVKLLDK
jgi:hypothetical protein